MVVNLIGLVVLSECLELELKLPSAFIHIVSLESPSHNYGFLELPPKALSSSFGHRYAVSPRHPYSPTPHGLFNLIAVPIHCTPYNPPVRDHYPLLNTYLSIFPILTPRNTHSF